MPVGIMKRKSKHRVPYSRLSPDSIGSLCGSSSFKGSKTKKVESIGYLFHPTQEILPPQIKDNFVPFEEDVVYDKLTGRPIVRKAKLDCTDYELRYLNFAARQINKTGEVDPDKISRSWADKYKSRKFSWLSSQKTRDSSQTMLFAWTPLKIEAAEMLSKGFSPEEVAKALGRQKYEVKHWLRSDPFRLEVSRRKLEYNEEHLESRKKELRDILDELGHKAKSYLKLLDHNNTAVNRRAISGLRVLLQEYRDFRQQERLDHEQATEIIKGNFDVIQENRFTIDAIASSIKNPAKRLEFLKNSDQIAEEIAEQIALSSAKNITPQIDDYSEDTKHLHANGHDTGAFEDEEQDSDLVAEREAEAAVLKAHAIKN